MCASHPRRAERNRTGRRPVGIYGVTAPAKGGSVTASKAQRDVDFADVFAARWPRLLRTTYAVTGDRQLAEDTLQSAFAKAYAAWARVSGADDPVAYVRRIAINVALQHHRRASTRRESVVEHTPEQPERAREDDLLAHDEVWVAIRTLPPRQRAVVVLRYYEDLSERQIADVLRCRPGTVKSQASAALTTLRARLAEAAHTPEGDRS
jgi:RNA polymerase sigma-70 factor (sigma-E family)